VVFRSHIDGNEHYITPEKVVQFQEMLGSDIMMVLDVCPESTLTEDKIKEAVNITTQWAVRCKEAQHDTGQHLFGIIQGGTYPALRGLSTKQLTELDFEGYAIGGLSLGESKVMMWEIVSYTVELMPAAKPRYLMGVGSPEDVFRGVELGIDVFDSALPTRVARNGALYTRTGRINIKKARYASDFSPIDSTCKCYTCSNYTAAYLNHLFRSEELLAYRLATIHNLHFMQSLIEEIRAGIASGEFVSIKKAFLDSYQVTDEITRIKQKEKYLDERRSESDN
jgi:queuine tRNA-ribosyltransferase